MSVALRYDVTAGENLSSLLAQLNDKLGALGQLRGALCSGPSTGLLDCDPGQWRGNARNQFDNGGGPFDTGYLAQQQQLGSLGALALQIQSQVDQANQQYTSMQRQATTTRLS